MNNPQTDLLTTHDAADMLGIKYATFHKRMTRGTLKFKPVANLGSQWLWSRADVEHYKNLMDK